MALTINTASYNTKTGMYVTETTGNYNAVTNPGGFGSPNATRANITTIIFVITQPDGSTVTMDIPTTFVTGTSLAYDVVNPASGAKVTLMDGVYTVLATYTSSVGGPYTTTEYILRDYDLRCAMGALALKDMKGTEYQKLKLAYDRMAQAFACEDYTLTQELMDDANALLDDCNGTYFNCGCGC
jgi:hypothetical protein